MENIAGIARAVNEEEKKNLMRIKCKEGAYDKYPEITVTIPNRLLMNILNKEEIYPRYRLDNERLKCYFPKSEEHILPQWHGKYSYIIHVSCGNLWLQLTDDNLLDFYEWFKNQNDIILE